MLNFFIFGHILKMVLLHITVNYNTNLEQKKVFVTLKR